MQKEQQDEGKAVAAEGGDIAELNGVAPAKAIGHCPLQISAVKDPEEENTEGNRVFYDSVPDPYIGAALLLVAPIRSGKSTLISNLLLSTNWYRDLFGENLYIISSTIFNDVTSRFIREANKERCFPEYDDSIIDYVVQVQNRKVKQKEKDQSYAVILDDCFGSLSPSPMAKKGRAFSNLTTRLRHYAPRADAAALMIYSTQKFKDCPAPFRANATAIALSKRILNANEFRAIEEEYASACGGQKLFRSFWAALQASPNPYSFLWIHQNRSPVEVWLDFDTRLK